MCCLSPLTLTEIYSWDKQTSLCNFLSEICLVTFPVYFARSVGDWWEHSLEVPGPQNIIHCNPLPGRFLCHTCLRHLMINPSCSLDPKPLVTGDSANHMCHTSSPLEFPLQVPYLQWLPFTLYFSNSVLGPFWMGCLCIFPPRFTICSYPFNTSVPLPVMLEMLKY